MSAAIIIIIFIIHVIAHSCTPSLIARWTRIHSFCYFLSLGRSHVSSRLTGACFQMLVFDSVQGSCLWPPEVGAGPQCDLGVRVLLSGSSIPSHPSTTYWLLWVGGIVATEDRVPRESWRRGHPQPDLCGTEQVPHGLVLSPFSRPGLPTKS